MKKFIPVILAATIVGCANEPEREPTILEVTKLSSNVDSPRFTGVKFIEAPIDLVVSDVRYYNQIGEVDDLLKEGIHTHSSSENVQKIFQANLKEMLTAQGFKVKTRSEHNDYKPTYSVKITDYKVTFDKEDYVEAHVSVEVDLFNGTERLFKKFDGTASYLATQFPLAQEFESVLDTVTQNVLNDMATNPDIILFAKQHFEKG